ncbi:hypothetical protein KSS87_021920 [Heliosperma pusillum]|nr:hypothetical protein KSS87_021920 [Heliosperma pusillum]
MKEDLLFTQGVTMQKMGNEGRLIVHTRSYTKELPLKQWVMKEDSSFT